MDHHQPERIAVRLGLVAVLVVLLALMATACSGDDWTRPSACTRAADACARLGRDSQAIDRSVASFDVRDPTSPSNWPTCAALTFGKASSASTDPDERQRADDRLALVSAAADHYGQQLAAMDATCVTWLRSVGDYTTTTSTPPPG